MSKIRLYANDKLGNPTFADVDAMKCRGGAKSSPSGEREKRFCHRKILTVNSGGR